jgi:uncharacterized membrane protein
MAKVYYVGDWAVMTGPVFAESPFNYSHKGLEVYNYGHWLKDALEKSGQHEVESVATWDFYKMGPGEYEQILADYDLLIFSDIEAKIFQLAPSFFDRTQFGYQILTFPDRIRLTVEAIEAGKGAMFLGGWLSFTGEMGKGGWKRTRLQEVLPVTCLDHEDLVESTEGFTAEITSKGRQLFGELDFTTFPPILGYNQTRPRDDCALLLKVAQTGDPLVAAGQFGRGKTLAYMSDPAPHWGCNFVYWEHYADFWMTCLNYLIDGD